MKNNSITSPEEIKSKWDEIAKRFDAQTKKNNRSSDFNASFYEESQQELQDDFRHHEFVRQ